MRRRQQKDRKSKGVEIKEATLNTGTISGRGSELADTMERRKVVRWKGSKAKNIGGGLKLFHCGVDGKRNGAGLILKEQSVRSCSGREESVGLLQKRKRSFWGRRRKKILEGGVSRERRGRSDQSGAQWSWW